MWPSSHQADALAGNRVAQHRIPNKRPFRIVVSRLCVINWSVFGRERECNVKVAYRHANTFDRYYAV